MFRSPPHKRYHSMESHRAGLDAAMAPFTVLCKIRWNIAKATSVLFGSIPGPCLNTTGCIQHKKAQRSGWVCQTLGSWIKISQGLINHSLRQTKQLLTHSGIILSQYFCPFFHENPFGFSKLQKYIIYQWCQEPPCRFCRFQERLINFGCLPMLL